MNQEEHDLLLKFKKTVKGQLLVLLNTTEVLVSLCESMEKTLEALNLMAAETTPEKPMHEKEEKEEKEKDRGTRIENEEDDLDAAYAEYARLYAHRDQPMTPHPEEESGWIG